ncbi:exosortase/archaeosortase family protein [Chloroflexota bacterium]
MKIARNRQLIGPLLTGFVFITLYCSVLIWLVGAWLYNPYYSHGFLILPVAVFVAWTRRKELVRVKPYLTGIIVLAIGLATYVAGFAWKIYSLSAFSLLAVAFGLVLYIFGTKAARSMAFPICFLIFMIPLPFIDSMSIPLQSITASVSASIVLALGIPATRTGVEIYLSEATFIIGTPCSGMNTLISLLALTTLFLYFVKAPFYKKVSLFLLTFPIAILANIFRISLLLVIAYYLGADAAQRYFHDFSNLLLFVLAVALLILLAKVLRCKIGTLTELING